MTFPARFLSQSCHISFIHCNVKTKSHFAVSILQDSMRHWFGISHSPSPNFRHRAVKHRGMTGVSLSPVPSRFWGLMRRPCRDPFGLNMDRMKHSNPSLRPSAAPTLKLLSLDLLIGRYPRYPTKNLRSACCSMCLVCLACIHKALLSIANVLREGPSESSSLGRKDGHGMV